MNPYTIEATLTIRFPDGTVRRCVMPIDEHHSGFKPLPVARELLYPDAMTAKWQQSRREQAASHICHTLASGIKKEILRFVEERDTINGYSKKEWEFVP